MDKNVFPNIFRMVSLQRLNYWSCYVHPSLLILHKQGKEKKEARLGLPWWSSGSASTFNAEDAGSIPVRGAKSLPASWPRNQNIKQKPSCNKFHEDFKNGPRERNTFFWKRGKVNRWNNLLVQKLQASLWGLCSSASFLFRLISFDLI